MIVGSNITHLKEATIQRKTRHNNETSGENHDYGESGYDEEYESDEYDVEGAGIVILESIVSMITLNIGNSVHRLF